MSNSNKGAVVVLTVSAALVSCGAYFSKNAIEDAFNIDVDVFGLRIRDNEGDLLNSIERLKEHVDEEGLKACSDSFNNENKEGHMKQMYFSKYIKCLSERKRDLEDNVLEF